MCRCILTHMIQAFIIGLSEQPTALCGSKESRRLGLLREVFLNDFLWTLFEIRISIPSHHAFRHADLTHHSKCHFLC